MAVFETLGQADKTEFGTKKFADDFLNSFIAKLEKNTDATNLIFRNLTRENEARAQSNVFLRSIYSAGFTDGNLVLTRANAEKVFYLKATRTDNKNNFPVDFSYKFGGKYIISLKDGNFKVSSSFD